MNRKIKSLFTKYYDDHYTDNWDSLNSSIDAENNKNIVESKSPIINRIFYFKRVAVIAAILVVLSCSFAGFLYTHYVSGKNDIIKINIMGDDWKTIEYFPGRNEIYTTRIGALEYTTKDNMEYPVTDPENIKGEIIDQSIARFENLSIVPVSEGVTTLKVTYQGLTIDEKITIKKAIPKKLLLNGSENKIYAANNDTEDLVVDMISESGKLYELKPEDYTLNIENKEIMTESISSGNVKRQLTVKKPGETEASVSYQGLIQKFTIVSTDDNNFVIKFGDKILKDGSIIDYNTPGLFYMDGTPCDNTGSAVDINCFIQQPDGQQLNITNECSWKVSNEKVFIIEKAVGYARGKYINPGTCIITAEYKGKTVTFTIKN